MAEASILILGATGAVGAALARRVAARGLRPGLVARDAARLAALATEIPGSIAIPTDVEDAAALRGAVGRQQQEIHASSQGHDAVHDTAAALRQGLHGPNVAAPPAHKLRL